MFLFKHISVNTMVDSLALNSEPTALQLMPDQSLSNTQIFSIRHITACLLLGTQDSSSVICLGVILDSKITSGKKSPQKCKKWGIK